MPKKKYEEIVVIGAGPGGYTAAFRAADLGKNVTLVDKDPVLGGVCLNRGCIPSKALLHIAKVISEVGHLSKMGVRFGKPEIDINQVRDHKDKIIARLNKSIAQMAKARNVNTIKGTASFLSNSELSIKTVNGTEKIIFDNCIIAAGARALMLPGTPKNNPNVLTSKTALELTNIPDTLLVIGGGIIGLELGQVYAVLGSNVTVVEFLPTLIPGVDADIVKPLYRKLSKQFDDIILSSKVINITDNDNDTLLVTIENKDETLCKEFDKVLVAVGRKPNTDLLKIENTDIVVDENGFIPVNEYQRTTVENIYAIGDIAGKPMLAHKATHEGKVAAEVAAGQPAVFDVQAIPSVVYTDPEIAWAGLTEIEAQEKGVVYKKGEFPWAASGRAIVIGASQGKTKILFEPNSNKILGVGIVGSGAGDLISEAVLALEMGTDAEDLCLTIHPHPTLSETVGLAAEVFTGTITDLYLQKK